MAVEMHKADPGYRRWVLIALALSVGLGTWLLWSLQMWLSKLGARPEQIDADALGFWLSLIIAGFSLALALPTASLATWLRRQAQSVRIEGRYPPARMATMRDLPVQRDAAALAWAKRLERLALALYAIAAGIGVWGAWAWLRFA